MFLYCYLGKLATESYEKMADCLFESDWQKLPVALQKYVIVMIADMQKPICYHGFGMYKLDSQTFIAVSHFNGVIFNKMKLNYLLFLAD